MVEVFTFAVASAVLFGTTGVYLWLFSAEKGGTALYTVPATITFVAGVAYAVMTLSTLGYVGDFVVEARYADWLVTTPLLVYTLATIAGTDRATKLKAMAADALMILLGYAASILPAPGKWIGFVLSSVAFGVLIYYLVTSLTEAAGEQPPTVEAMFVSLRDLTVFLWVVFPLLWLVSPFGFGLLRTVDHEFLLAFVDIAAKGVFNLIIALRTRAIQTTVGAEYLGSLSAGGAAGGETA